MRVPQKENYSPINWFFRFLHSTKLAENSFSKLTLNRNLYFSALRTHWLIEDRKAGVLGLDFGTSFFIRSSFIQLADFRQVQNLIVFSNLLIDKKVAQHAGINFVVLNGGVEIQFFKLRPQLLLLQLGLRRFAHRITDKNTFYARVSLHRPYVRLNLIMATIEATVILERPNILLICLRLGVFTKILLSQGYCGAQIGRSMFKRSRRSFAIDNFFLCFFELLCFSRFQKIALRLFGGDLRLCNNLNINNWSLAQFWMFRIRQN